MNLALWASINTALTTANGSNAASVASGTGLAAGVAINSVNVPLGTTVGAISGTGVTLAFPPGTNAGAVVTGADAAAVFTGAGITFNGTIQLERSFDGAKTWLVCNVGGFGVLAQWSGAAVTQLNLTFGEPEKQVLYRLNCTVLFDGNKINYRISQTGGAAESLAIGPLAGG